MRIMIVTDQYSPQIGGVPTVTQELAAHFVDRGHQVWVVAPSYGILDEDHLTQKVNVCRFFSFQWPTGGQRIPLFSVVTMRHLLKRTDPDIIHVHTPVVLGNLAQSLPAPCAKPTIPRDTPIPLSGRSTLPTNPYT